MIASLLAGLESEKACVKYGAAKALRRCSERNPAEIYPYFERFVSLMDGDNTFLRWGSQRILGNLAASDGEGRFEPILDRFLAPISGHELIGAANAIEAAAQVALAKPYLADRIAMQMLKVRRAVYATPECRNVAIGHVLRSMDRFFHLVKQRDPVLRFVKRQLANPRAATRNHAARFLKHASAQEAGVTL